MGTSVPFHTCGTECPAYGETKAGRAACFFGHSGRAFKGSVASGQACIHTVDRKLLRNLRGALRRAEDKLEKTHWHRDDLRELVKTLEVVLSHKGV